MVDAGFSIRPTIYANINHAKLVANQNYGSHVQITACFGIMVQTESPHPMSAMSSTMKNTHFTLIGLFILLNYQRSFTKNKSRLQRICKL
jgi:hypothetical protein